MLVCTGYVYIIGQTDILIVYLRLNVFFSFSLVSDFLLISWTHHLLFPFSVFKAVNISEHCVAACKVISLTEQTTETERKTVKKEMRIHAGGGELFDKIGRFDFCLSERNVSWTHHLFFSPCKTAPDVGVDEDIAHLYFDHLIAGMVCHPLHDPTYCDAHVIAH